MMSLIKGYEKWLCQWQCPYPLTSCTCWPEEGGVTFKTVCDWCSGKAGAGKKQQQKNNNNNCKLWHRLRLGRVTASQLHSVCHTNPDNPHSDQDTSTEMQVYFGSHQTGTKAGTADSKTEHSEGPTWAPIKRGHSHSVTGNRHSKDIWG